MKIRDPREVARRMAESLRSDLYGFVFSPSIIDSGVVSKLVALSGSEKYLTRYARGNVIVYAIRRDIVRAKCRYEECGDAPRESRDACLADCFIKTMRELADMIAKSILEAGEVIEEKTG